MDGNIFYIVIVASRNFFIGHFKCDGNKENDESSTSHLMLHSKREIEKTVVICEQREKEILNNKRSNCKMN